MERLETKKIHGRTYYYYSRWAWVNGRCRRVWQKYLGKLEDIVKSVEGSGPAPLYAEVFQFGLPTGLWQQCQAMGVVECTDRICPKRKQGLSTGEYLALAAVNRAVQPRSKRSMWDWFSQTTLLRCLPQASAATLASQRFWDHMDRIDAAQAHTIWKELLRGVVQREKLDLSAISYDGTNFFTFMDTFNAHSRLARRGKNKQGRGNLRQISYALFCCQDGPLPLFWTLYEGNRTDVRQFPIMLSRFHEFFREISGGGPLPKTTLIFDKGNNSQENFGWLDRLKIHFVGSVKLGEHKELAEVSNGDTRFVETALEGTRAFRVRKVVYGRERTLVVTYSHKLFQAQWLTMQNDLNKALEQLSLLQGKLRDRAAGLIRGGKPPTVESVHRKCTEILKRQHLKELIPVRVEGESERVPIVHYALDPQALHRIADTYLGKTLLITDREEWDDSTVIRAYRSQFLIESVFQQTKDRHIGSWWPLHHWTDSKILVHGLYCTIALLIRAVLLRRVQKAGLRLSMKRFLSELDRIREVVNIYPKKRRDQKRKTQTVLTKTSDLQNRIMAILGLQKEEF